MGYNFFIPIKAKYEHVGPALSHIMRWRMRVRERERDNVLKKSPKQLKFMSAVIEKARAERGLRAKAETILKDYVAKGRLKIFGGL